MLALAISKDLSVELKEVTNPSLKSGEARVQIKAAALNRRDQWIREGKYPGIIPGAILGSDGGRHCG